MVKWEKAKLSEYDLSKVGSIETTKGRMSEQRRGKSTGKDEDKVDSMMMKMLNAAANDDDAQGYD